MKSITHKASLNKNYKLKAYNNGSFLPSALSFKLSPLSLKLFPSNICTTFNILQLHKL
jgi:hypothetical protein